ncbi:translation initiation factor IF-2 associated domain-containing protein, partial [Teichococcus deserti]|uniref:translation initiation factor IF-2 associated domain-containing protein n=1 Tax=Teichococcus deserti TaxID=1817963 RepID=UPI001A966AE6
MSDQNEQDAAKSRLSLRPGGRLELGKTEAAGTVRQSFSHGRGKTVQVEVVKKRAGGPPAPGGKPASGPATGPRPAGGPQRSATGPANRGGSGGGGGGGQQAGRPLNQAEQATRLRVLEEHRRMEAQRQREERERQALMVRSAAEEAARKVEEERRRAEEEAERAVEEARQKAEDEVRRKAEAEARRNAPPAAAAPAAPAPAA